MEKVKRASYPMIRNIILLLIFFSGIAATAHGQCNTTYNVAIGKTATASSIENAGLPASQAFDANMATRWSSAFTDNEYIYVDLGAPYPLCQVVLNWETALGKNFTIDISNDAVTWTTAITVTGNTSFNNTLSISGTGRYVRMKGTLRGTGYGYSLYEFQVYSTLATPVCPATNIALGKTATASSLESGAYPASNVNDGNAATRWSSAFSDPQYIYLNLGSIYNICSVNLTWENAYGKNFTIDASNDAVTWTTLATVTGNSSLTNSISVLGSGKYVRMNGTARGTLFGYSLYEMSVTGSSILPVTLKNFKANAESSGSVKIQWNTEIELNNNYFEIERSTDAQHFIPLGTVAGHGNSDIEQSYSFTDDQPAATINYYRLKQVDLDGRSTYSPIATVDLTGANPLSIQVFPNPATSLITIRSQNSEPVLSVSIYNQNGMLVIQQKTSGSDLVAVPVQQLLAGLYFVRVMTSHDNRTFRVLKL